MLTFKVLIDEYHASMRLDKATYLIAKQNGDNVSRSDIQKAIKNGHLRLNGQIISNLSAKVKENDQVKFMLEEEIPEHLVPANIPLDIVYEDDDVIVINKPAGLTTHPGAGEHTDTLANALIFHTKYLSDVGGEFRPGIVHRLDKDTSGLMVVAKNNQAHRSLAAQIESRDLTRRYKALIWGMIKPFSGTIKANIGRSQKDRTKMTTLKNGGKVAITHYNTLDVYVGGLISLVECKLDTGRTHQIRVHMSHAGHSIVGDQVYGNNSRKLNTASDAIKEVLSKFKRQALHSFYISFSHPSTGDLMEFEKEAPEDFNLLIEAIKIAKSI